MNHHLNRADVIVIGGGAAGLMAAARCAGAGLSVLLAERNDRLGRKILITGKGRCNVTNNCDPDTVLKNTLRGSRFLYSAVGNFTPADTMEYFESRGVKLKTERGNRVFPASDRAEEIRRALQEDALSAGAKYIHARVSSLILQDKGVAGVRLEDGDELYATCVLLATGGLSYPGTGSTGDGYRMARAAGHTVTECTGSLVPLVCREEDIPTLQGLSLRNVTLSLWQTGKKKPVYKELGEMLFTHYGISGPLVLSASAYVETGREYTVTIDLKPGLDDGQLDARLLRDFDTFKNSDFSNALYQLLPRKIIPAVVGRSGIDPHKKVNAVTREERRDLRNVMRAFTCTVQGKRPVQEAIVTRGGVSLREIDPKTMASKLVPGLFFAGEIMDLDGFTGGFNLQIAFSTAVAAAKGIQQMCRP